ncbi:MAG: general secretion pathway protein G [Pseudohongiellaceae bacterium]|jgi:general secretion pathway protein G
MSSQNRKQTGFTLVELLIVVIILGILAAVVIPQFNSAANESKEAALASNLATVRQSIEMYKVQHDDTFPDATNFAIQLTGTTGVDGATTGTTYGPYIRNDLPNEPFSGVNTVIFTAVDNAGGWAFDVTTGQFQANNTDLGPSGIALDDL